MKILFLGSGTSTGVPVIGCKCSICSSDNPKNRRTRASILISNNSRNILIDTATDLRFQALTYSIERIDAVFFTHAHADHIHGIDELRSFNHLQGGAIPCYGSGETLEAIRYKFGYVFNGGDSPNNWTPRLLMNIIEDPFELYGLRILPLKIFHGDSIILAYRINDMAYVTDCSGIPHDSMDSLRDMRLLVLDATRYQPHSKHYGLSQAIKVIEELKPEKAILTHLSHAFEHDNVNKELPPGIELAYDGMIIENA